MNAVLKWVKEHAKSLAAAVGGALATLLMKFVNGEAPWPQNQQEWVNAAIGAVVAGVLAWLPTNKITQKQLDKDPAVPPGVVLLPDAPQAPVEGEYKSTWQKP